MRPRLHALLLPLGVLGGLLGGPGCSPLIYLASGGGPDDVQPLGVDAQVQGTTDGGHDDFAPRCAGNEEAPDAAYALEVPRTGRYLIGVQADYDAVVAIYQGDRLLACNDDHEVARRAQVVVELEARRRYIVVVDGWGGDHGDFELAVHARDSRSAAGDRGLRPNTAPPAEDVAALEARCAAAETLAPGRTGGVLIPSESHAVVGCGAGGRGPEAVYRVEVDGPTRFDVEVTSELDAVVELRRGCSTDHQVLACVDDAPDPMHTGLSADLMPGENYFLIIDSYAVDAGGTFEIEATFTPRDGPQDSPQSSTQNGTQNSPPDTP
ncbi:MAG: hypothetical protein JRH11_19025 [Deltaproteobacteria bacterium]|nr:hypothetical protein [Deltaproteobacteria bacterium]